MDSLRIVGADREVDLYPWLNSKAKGIEALAGIVGFGMPAVTNFWFDGASGSTWRGSRIERRVSNIPMQVYAENRLDLSQQLSDLATILDPFVPNPLTDKGAARLFFGGPDDNEWFVDVVRSGGGEWSRKVDSDDRTYFKTVIQLEAGDAFWTRNDPEQFIVNQTSSGNTLLPKIARLRVGSEATVGVREVTNVGDTFAWPIITLVGPATHLVLTGPQGEVLEWTGTLTAGQTLTIDMRANTVEDQSGANRYGGLATAPRFWSIAPGTSEVSVQIDGMSSASILTTQWWPRRWAVV